MEAYCRGTALRRKKVTENRPAFQPADAADGQTNSACECSRRFFYEQTGIAKHRKTSYGIPAIRAKHRKAPYGSLNGRNADLKIGTHVKCKAREL